MKKLLTIYVLLGFSLNLFADIAVTSFKKLDADLDARVNEPLKDQNGDLCAIIKVVTTQIGFTFDCGQIGIMKTVQKPSEIWVYVPYGAKRITIKHAQLGMLRDYLFPTSIEKATVYEMVVLSGKVETIVVDEITSQWLVITPEPADAMVYLDDQFVKSGTYQAKRKPGTYTYRVEAPLYHTEAGKVELSDTKKELSVKLKPAFGYISIESEPESEAHVSIDGKQLGKNTPCLSEPLASGVHTVQIVKEMYQPEVQTVVVSDDQTTSLHAVLRPNFAEVNINAPDEANIYVNNQQKGTGSWKGRLSAGIYSLEAHQAKHRDAKQDVELVTGENRTFELQPTPIYGSLDVVTIPPGATITIERKEYGQTPNTIEGLLIGEYEVTLSKPGFNTISTSVTVVDGKTSELNETFTNGEEVKITSEPSDAALFVDDVLVGQTPYAGRLSVGSHTLRAEKDFQKSEKSVDVMYSDQRPNIKNNFTLILKGNPISLSGSVPAIKTDKPQWDDDIYGSSAMNKSPSNMGEGKSSQRFNRTCLYLGYGLVSPLVENCYSDYINEVTIGVGRKLGFYGKAKFSSANYDVKIDYKIDDLNNNFQDYYSINSNERMQYSRLGLSGGLMLNFRPVTFLIGAGWGYFNQYKKATLCSYEYDYPPQSILIGNANSVEGIQGDFGVIVRAGLFGFSLGITSIEAKYYEASVGLGLYF